VKRWALKDQMQSHHVGLEAEASVHVAFQGSADTVVGVGKMAAPDEPVDHSVRKTHYAVVQSQEVGKACWCAAGVGPSLEVIVGTEAEAVGNPQVAVWDDAGEATLAGLA
jgi:hypothetical protein